uniref:Uncharacterized protein n=1 Tax=Lepeophtheirus salmonis TaxID=72036 RepID=A0A0K2T5W8_LEPSM
MTTSDRKAEKDYQKTSSNLERLPNFNLIMFKL